MKSLSFIILSIIFIKASAQSFQPFEDHKGYSDVMSLPILEGSTLYYLRHHYRCDTNFYFNNIDHYGVRLDLKTNSRTEKKISLNSSNLVYGSLHSQFYKGAFYSILPFTYSTSIPFTNSLPYCNLHLMKFDTLFNLIDSKPIQGYQSVAPINNLFNFINDTSILMGLIVQGTYNPIHTILNPQTGITSNSFLINDLNTFEKQIVLSDSTFIISYENKIRYFKFPLTLYDSLIVTPSITSSFEAERYSDNMVNQSIVYNYIADSNGSKYNRVLLVNPYTKAKRYIYKAPAPPNANMNYAWVDCATTTDNYILTTNNYRGGATWDFGNTIYTTSQVEVNKMDTNGNLQWQRIIGGDAAYFTDKVLATPDSGCLIFANRYDSSINHFENDTYYIKLDKDGNQQYSYLPTSVPSTPEFLPSIILYPNPSSTTIAISNLNPQQRYTYTILDSKGATVSKGIYRQPIEVTSLSSGIYYLSIEHNNQRRTLRFVKQ